MLGLLWTMMSLLLLVAGDKCSDNCSCKWKNGKRTVECIDRALAAIPKWIDPETQVLDVTNNDLKSLPSQVFHSANITNLQKLYLRGCKLSRIESRAFEGLTNLVELDLSNNRLAQVPSESFAQTPFLRDLVLANNPLNRVTNGAFRRTQNLVKLDLSFTGLVEIDPKGFAGLESLESLKLNNNALKTFRPGIFDSLKKLASIELHDNPWICDCQLREMKTLLVKQNLPTQVAPVCNGPQLLYNKQFTELHEDDFACKPVMLITSNYADATIGENASIVCRVSAVPAAATKWYWNNRQLTNHSTFGNHQKIFIYEDGQFQKRSTLVITNAQEVDSGEFACVADNRAGSVLANFTLHVSLRTAGMYTLGSGHIAGISVALVILILFVLLVILVLFARLKRLPQTKDSKEPVVRESTPSGGADQPLSQNSRQKSEELSEAMSFVEAKPISLNLSYVQRPREMAAVIAEEYGSSITRYEEPLPGPCYSSTTSLMPIDNPDLIRDTRQEEVYAELSRMVDDTKLLYSSGWSERIAMNTYSVKESTTTTTTTASGGVDAPLPPLAGGGFPPGAKQMRVWQKGVPVLPPVSALKRVLGSTRSSPDEGYQEGTGTDV